MCMYNFDKNENFLNLKIKPLVLRPKASTFGGEKVAVGRGRERGEGGMLTRYLRLPPTESKACAFDQGLESGPSGDTRPGLPLPTAPQVWASRSRENPWDSVTLGHKPIAVRADAGPDPRAFIEHLLYTRHLHRCPPLTLSRTPGSRWLDPHVHVQMKDPRLRVVLPLIRAHKAKEPGFAHRSGASMSSSLSLQGFPVQARRQGRPSLSPAYSRCWILSFCFRVCCSEKPEFIMSWEGSTSHWWLNKLGPRSCGQQCLKTGWPAPSPPRAPSSPGTRWLSPSPLTSVGTTQMLHMTFWLPVGLWCQLWSPHIKPQEKEPAPTSCSGRNRSVV